MQRYAQDLHKATSEFTTLYSLVYGPNDSRPKGTKILEGIFTKNDKFHFINYLNPVLTVKGYKDVIDETHRQGGFVHYTAGYIFPYGIEQRDVVTIHDVYPLLYPSKIPLTERIYYERSLERFKRSKLNNILTNSKFTKNVLEENGFESKITAIHLPISEVFKRVNDKVYARKVLGLPTDKKIILSVSNLQWRKNLKGILETMGLLGSEYVLIRVGPKIGNSISFEYIDDSDMNLLYNAADALLYPSFYEGFGYVPLEAAKVGVPVVVSDIPVFREVLGDYAVYVDPSDSNDISRGVREAVSMETGPKIIDFNEFTLLKFGQDMTRFYERNA
ncbi:MAG: glycosyltransferase family 1 protein [Candidatus Parvarchaeota archaeon]